MKFSQSNKISIFDAGNGDDVSQIELAKMLAKYARLSLCVDSISGQYYMKSGNIWKAVPEHEAKLFLQEFHVTLTKRQSIGFFEAVVRQAKINMMFSDWETSPELIPVKNGVYDTKSKTLNSYDDYSPFTWQLEFEFEESARCPLIDRWFQKVSGNNSETIEFLMCFMAAVITSRYDLQKYLVITGPGGTGKSTFLRLLVQLVGSENVWSTTAKMLENNQYETANLYGKRLSVISDAEEYNGELTVLKQLTGGDNIRYERKYKNAEVPFLYQGMVLILSNHPLGTSDKSSAISRRQLVAIFDQVVTEAEKSKNPDFEAQLFSELPGLFNQLVAIHREAVTGTLRQLPPSLEKAKLRLEFDTNSILGWLHEHVVCCEAGQETTIGLKPPGSIRPYEARLYPNYVEYCEDHGVRPVGLNKFSNTVVDNCLARGIKTEKCRIAGDGKTILAGLRLRNESDNEGTYPLLFE